MVVGTVMPATFGLLAGVPEPKIHDEYSYLLGADTFAHGRLTNPSPPLPEFFEAPHVLVAPTYQSKYPPGQALVLAVGIAIFGHPIWGVWMSCGLFAGALCWMLQAWVARRWALVTTLLTVATVGTTTYWAQSYWGGMVTATGAALVFGGFRRGLQRPSVVSGIVVGVGLTVLAATRPFDGVLALVPMACILLRWLWQPGIALRVKVARFLLPASIVACSGLVTLGVYNRAITGAASRAPYQLHLEQYFYQGVFVFSPVREPLRHPAEHVSKVYQFYRTPPPALPSLIATIVENLALRTPATAAAAFGLMLAPGPSPPHYAGVMLWVALLAALVMTRRARTFFIVLIGGTVVEGLLWAYLPFYPGPLAPFVILGAVVIFDGVARNRQASRWILFSVGTVALGEALVPWWFPHYAAPVLPLISTGIAVGIARAAAKSRGRLPALGPTLAIVLATYLTTLLVLEGQRPVHATAPGTASASTSHFATREEVVAHLARRGGKHLVFVSYDSAYTVHREWVFNGANLMAQPVIFAHDLGPRRNADLMARLPDYAVWTARVASGGGEIEPVRTEARDEERPAEDGND
jgi:hypothetical protein